MNRKISHYFLFFRLKCLTLICGIAFAAHSFSYSMCLVITVINKTPNIWSLDTIPVVQGGTLASGLKSFQTIPPDQRVDVKLNSVDNFSLLSVKYSSGSAWMEETMTYTFKPDARLSFWLNSSKVNVVSGGDIKFTDGCNHAVLTLFPPQQYTLKIELKGSFTKASAATYVQQIVNNLSPEVLQQFDTSQTKVPYSYSLSSDGKTLDLYFTLLLGND